MIKHTRGPWESVNNWRGKIAIVGPDNNSKETTSDRIANLPWRNGEGFGNAKLIAAVPEMYGVCLELIRGDGTDASLQRAIDLAVKALRKIET